MKWSNLKPFKKLVNSNGGSTAGRNSAGRITIFHRGGGAKRLQRKIDLKRSTSSMGVVERIEYDPNRSSRVALVRWIEGVQPGHNKISEKGFSPPIQKPYEPITSTPAGRFPLACLAQSSTKEMGRKITSVRDVFVSAFSSQKSKSEFLANFPRMGVVAAKPAVFVPQNRDHVKEGEEKLSLSDLRRWKKDSVVWEHRLKRKAAISWKSFVRGGPIGLASAVSDEPESVGKRSKNQVGEREADCVPFTYILASNELEAGDTVMNCGWSKPPPHR